MLWEDFCNGAYHSRSENIAADRCVNLYKETRQVPGSPKRSALFGTPGQKSSGTVSTLGGRGWFSQDGRTWTVVGNTLYEQTDATTRTAIGTIPDDGLMVSWIDNGQGGNQLGIIGGGALYVLGLQDGSFVNVTLPFDNPVRGAFQDGYGLINEANSPIVWFSALEDLTSWDALDFFARSGTSDNCVALGVSQDRVGFFGSKTLTSFYDSGDADTPFLPYQGTTIMNGLATAQLLGVYRDNFFWVSPAGQGTYRVLFGTLTSAQPVSTHPIESWLARCSTLNDAYLTIYEQEGHPFFLITAPSSPDDIKTYGFDPTEKEAPWHARAGWNATTGQYTQWRVKGATVVNGTVFAGDYQTGDIYQLDLDTYTDNGNIIRRERTTPYLGAENQWAFIDQFELGTQAGVGLSTVVQGQDPVATLEVSSDSAHTFQSAGDSALGEEGDYDARTIWCQLGRSRLDRLVFRVTCTEPVKIVFGPGAWLRLAQGSGQL